MVIQIHVSHKATPGMYDTEASGHQQPKRLAHLQCMWSNMHIYISNIRKINFSMGFQYVILIPFKYILQPQVLYESLCLLLLGII